MNKLLHLFGIVILLVIALAAPAAAGIQAQNDVASACPAITLQALEATKALCSGAANNEVCYGHVMLEAQPQPNVSLFKFDTEGDIASVMDMASLRLSAMDTEASLWGVALMRLQVNLLKEIKREPVMLLLFGDVAITNRPQPAPSVTLSATIVTKDGLNAKLRSTPEGARIAALPKGTIVTATGRTANGLWIRIMLDTERSAWVSTYLLDTPQDILNTLDVVDSRSAIYAPMQAFYVESGENDAACPEAPNSGLMIQTPEGVAEITFLINEVDIQLGSTVFFQANAGKELTVSVIEGSAAVTARGVTRRAITGSQISVPLDETGAASGVPSLPRAYDWGYVMGLPSTYMDQPVPVAAPISAADLAWLRANQPGMADEPVVITADDGTITVIPPSNPGDPPPPPSDPGDDGGGTVNPPTPPPPDEPTATPPPPPPTPGDDTIVICHNGRTMTIKPDALADHLAHGDTLGACPGG